MISPSRSRASPGLHTGVRSVALLYWIGGYNGLAAQISPGPLSAVHSELEGSDQCMRCHSPQKGIDPDRCLSCHTTLKARLDSNLGFHATVNDRGCERCHMEHHGETFELVFWGDDGPSSFDHRATGYELRGAHSRADCRSCHRAELMPDAQALSESGKNLDRTYLGLDSSSCLSCHRDEHAGQFADRPCSDCHDSENWTTTLRFSHETARFQLAGRHSQVDCNRCHRPGRGDDAESGEPGPVRFVDLEFAKCSDCHRDPHRSQLGSSCRDCHSEESWQTIDRGRFDHDRTRFALRGSHRNVRCQSCHRQGLSRPIARFNQCSDCHRDRHLGQFTDRDLGSGCDACHGVETFRPARFSVTDHQSSVFALEGAHLAVPCNACHEPLSDRETRSLSIKLEPAATPPDYPVLRYEFESTECRACHQSAHESSIDRFMLSEGCRTCHELSTWSQIDFDHERTDYTLFGGHLQADCRRCHKSGSPSEASLKIAFEKTPRDCQGCHADEHASQFANRAAKTICETCHSPVAWQATHFDHDRDSEFALSGSHQGLPCQSCHQKERIGERITLRYRPVPTSCVECHTNSSIGRTDR